MAWRVIDAVRVLIDERTDLRAVVGESCPGWELAVLENDVNAQNGSLSVEPGLLGWGDFNVTLRCEDGACYHAQVEEV